MENVYEKVKEFKKRHPRTVAWRLKKNSRVVEDHLNPGEIVKYAFCAQKNNKTFDFFSTCVVAVTNKRLIIGQKRVAWGYFFYSITPDMYNDLQVRDGLFWGDIIIDTVKELVYLSNLAHSSLDEVETNVTEFMMKEKKKYPPRIDKN